MRFCCKSGCVAIACFFKSYSNSDFCSDKSYFVQISEQKNGAMWALKSSLNPILETSVQSLLNPDTSSHNILKMLHCQYFLINSVQYRCDSHKFSFSIGNQMTNLDCSHWRPNSNICKVWTHFPAKWAILMQRLSFAHNKNI